MGQLASAALRLWRWVERRRARTFTAREAWQGLKGGGLFSRMGDIEAALAALEERGYLRPLAEPSQPRPGRPTSPAFEVRPDFSEAWR